MGQTEALLCGRSLGCFHYYRFWVTFQQRLDDECRRTNTACNMQAIQKEKDDERRKKRKRKTNKKEHVRNEQPPPGRHKKEAIKRQRTVSTLACQILEQNWVCILKGRQSLDHLRHWKVHNAL